MALILRPEATTQALRERSEGRADNGTVNLRCFDEGVVTSMGATKDIQRQRYFLTIPNIDGPPGSPIDPLVNGELRVPIVFAIPEDVFSNYEIPIIVVRREAITPRLNAWHPGQLQYRAPSFHSRPIVYLEGTSYEKHGFDLMNQRQMAVPFSINYSISILSRHRGLTLAQRNQANQVFEHILKIYQPYTYIKLIDSIGDERTYDAFMSSVVPVDSDAEVAERVIGFSFSLDVMAELDLAPTETFVTMYAPSIRETLFEG